jgi:AraC family transcriptional regulator
MIGKCFRRLADGAARQVVPSGGPLRRELLRQAMQYVNGHLDSRLKWDDLAAEVGLEPAAFARRFKLATGVTPHQYIIRCRLNRAIELLLQSRTSLAHIALEIGCSSQSHLTTLFRKHLDTTPAAYRLSYAVRRTSWRPPAAGTATRDLCAADFP